MAIRPTSSSMRWLFLDVKRIVAFRVHHERLPVTRTVKNDVALRGGNVEYLVFDVVIEDIGMRTVWSLTRIWMSICGPCHNLTSGPEPEISLHPGSAS